MSKPNPVLVAAVLVATILALGGAGLLRGGLYVVEHEGDTMHLMQIVFRMVEGERPHLDFMTPIGLLAFAPIVALLRWGGEIGFGMAFLWSQLAVAVLLAPAVARVALSRFPGRLAPVFGFAVMVLVLALVHGEVGRLVSISMHYNRWSWAVAYLVIALAVLPALPGTARPRLDGALIGLGMAALALTKATYFVAFAPPVLLALVLRRQGRGLLAAVLAGLAVVAVVTALMSPAFWAAYLNDLATVARSDLRPQPGLPLSVLVGSPEYLGGTLALMAGVIFLRQAGERVLGLMLLLLAPGFIYVTFQNFGNDPQWLVLLALLLLVPSPAAELRNLQGWSVRGTLIVTATAAAALAAPSFLNLAYSPFRHAQSNISEYVPFLRDAPRHHDLNGRLVRANRVDGSIALDGPGSGLEDRQEIARRLETRVEVNGETLPECELKLGAIAWLQTIVDDLTRNGFAGRRLMVADIFAGHWLFGDIGRLKGAAPWYYGGLPGFEDAEYVLAPACPGSAAIRKAVLEEILKRGFGLTETRRTQLYILYEIARG